MIKNLFHYRIFLQSIVIAPLFGGSFPLFSQILEDTLKIESVSIYQKRPITGNLPGAKIISIDSLTIASKMNNNLADLLQENSPLFIKTYGRGSFATISMRGTGTSHTKVLWNGLNINSPMTGSVDFSTLPVYFIDDINIHYGQSSMVFGSGGLGGAVNLESNIEWSDRIGLKVFQTIGSYNTYSSAVKAVYGSKYNIRFQTRAFYESSENNFTYQNTADISKKNPMERQKNADYTKNGVLQEVHFKTKNNLIDANFWFSYLNRSIPKLMSNYSVDEKNRQLDYTTKGLIRWRYFTDYSNLEVSVGYYTQAIDYFLIKYPAYNSPEKIVDNNNGSTTFFNNVKYEKAISTWLNLSLGSRLNRDDVNTFDYKTTQGYSHQRTELSLFTSLGFKPAQFLKFDLLFLKDLLSKYADPVLPSLSAELKPFKKNNLFIKSTIARNYHIPSLNDLYWNPGGNPNLKPEKSTTYESGVKYDVELGGYSGEVEVTGFSSRIENWVMWLPSFKGSWEPRNIDFVNNKGVEFSLNNVYNLDKIRFILKTSYSYSKTTHNGKQLPFIPLQSAVISSTLQIKKIHITHNFCYYSERFTTTSNNPNQVKTLYPYYMNSLSTGVTQMIRKSSVHFIFRIDNLFNESYQSILWRPMPGRNYSLNIMLDL